MADSMKHGLVSALKFTDNVYTKDGVDEAIANALKGGYKAKGSVTAVTDLPTLSSGTEGWMYNMSSGFTTTSDFAEGPGHVFPAGTNVVCVEVSGTYYWDVLAGEGVQPSSTTPAANGTAATGSENAYARGDHVHPTDTTRAAAADLTSHTGDTTVHVTAAERTAWNAKASTAVATAAADGLMSKDDKSKLDEIAAGANHGFAAVTGYNGNTQGNTATGSSLFIMGSGSLSVSVTQVTTDQASVTLSVPDASTSVKGVVQLSSATNSTSTALAATASAVKAAYDRGSSGVTAAAAAAATANAEKTARTSGLLTAIHAIAASGQTLDQIKGAMATLGDTKDKVASLILAIRNFAEAASA